MKSFELFVTRPIVLVEKNNQWEEIIYSEFREFHERVIYL